MKWSRFLSIKTEMRIKNKRLGKEPCNDYRHKESLRNKGAIISCNSIQSQYFFLLNNVLFLQHKPALWHIKLQILGAKRITFSQSRWLIQSVFSKSTLISLLVQSTLNYATFMTSPWAFCNSSIHTCVNNVVAEFMKGRLALNAWRKQPAQGVCYYGNTVPQFP